MKESELYPPVRDWLVARGYEIHVEVFDCDIVAVKDDKLTAIELKLGLTWDLVNQLCSRIAWADFIIGAVPGVRGQYGPDVHRGQVRAMGLGILLVSGSKVHQMLAPRPQPWGWQQKHAYRLKKLTGRPPAMEHEVAGLPSCPALRAQRALRGGS
jgi:hypothetical protein